MLDTLLTGTQIAGAVGEMLQGAPGVWNDIGNILAELSNSAGSVMQALAPGEMAGTASDAVSRVEQQQQTAIQQIRELLSQSAAQQQAALQSGLNLTTGTLSQGQQQALAALQEQGAGATQAITQGAAGASGAIGQGYDQAQGTLQQYLARALGAQGQGAGQAQGTLENYLARALGAQGQSVGQAQGTLEGYLGQALGRLDQGYGQAQGTLQQYLAPALQATVAGYGGAQAALSPYEGMGRNALAELATGLGLPAPRAAAAPPGLDIAAFLRSLTQPTPVAAAQPWWWGASPVARPALPPPTVAQPAPPPVPRPAVAKPLPAASAFQSANPAYTGALGAGNIKNFIQYSGKSPQAIAAELAGQGINPAQVDMAMAWQPGTAARYQQQIAQPIAQPRGAPIGQEAQ